MFVAQLTKSADEGGITERTLCYIGDMVDLQGVSS